MRDTLARRIHLPLIKKISRQCHDHSLCKQLFALAFDPDERISYNALWIFTHFDSKQLLWLMPLRDRLIDYLLDTPHIGIQRLILTILEQLPPQMETLRTDYIDFCMSRINSTLPYAIRALCLKQAYAQCRFYQELIGELKAEIEILDLHTQSPGITSARRKVLRKIAAYERSISASDGNR